MFALCSILVSVVSCTKSDVLKEVPKGFLSPENAFSDQDGVKSAIADLYRESRGLVTVESWTGEGDKITSALYASGTDLGWYWDKQLNFGDYTLINPTDALATQLWQKLYKLIQGANLIISRLGNSPIADDQKKEDEAEAKWFRAYGYRYLVYLYGDVPKVTEEITEPKFDYVRAPKDTILALMISDWEFASRYLPAANPGDGHLSRAAADHFLTETFISTGRYDSAIAAATRVIGDGQYHLMTARFGKYKDKPGDVFWDMFRLGNQNRSGGNMESILVWQMEYGVQGGEATYPIERSWGPYMDPLKDSKGNSAIVPADSLGRPVSFIVPSPYLDTLIWHNDPGDIRNSSYNMQRVLYNNNPISPEFGQAIPRPATPNRNYHVWVKKASCPEGHPQGYDPNGKMYTDIYAIRLAETYLLRAEAYLDKSDKEDAAADINVVRARAQAAPVAPEAVDMDYILDERARELAVEEPRRLTLARLGLLYERVQRYNAVSAPTIQAFNNLLPIPQNIIDANTGAAFSQNTGY